IRSARREMIAPSYRRPPMRRRLPMSRVPLSSRPRRRGAEPAAQTRVVPNRCFGLAVGLSGASANGIAEPPERGQPVPDHSAILPHWLDRLRQGDWAARNALIRHSRDRLRLLTRQMLRRFPGVQRWEDASDILQKALIRLDRALGEVHPAAPRDFLRLAATQIRRELIDLSRRRPPDLPVPEPVAAASRPHADDPYQLSLWTEFHSRIAAMPEDDRELIELLYYQGVSQPEAAQLLGVPLTTLKRHWKETRVRLLAQLGGVLPG